MGSFARNTGGTRIRRPGNTMPSEAQPPDTLGQPSQGGTPPTTTAPSSSGGSSVGTQNLNQTGNMVAAGVPARGSGAQVTPAAGSPGAAAAAPPPNQQLLSQIANQQVMRPGLAQDPGGLSTAGASGIRGAVTSGAQAGGGDTPASSSAANTPDQMWEDIMSQYDENGKRIESRALAYESNAARRASELSQGSATGGSFAAGMAQASMSGLDNRQKLNMEHEKQGLTLRMTQLQNAWKEAMAKGDREHAEQMQSMMDRTQLQIAAMDNGLDMPMYDEEGNLVPNSSAAPAGGTYGDYATNQENINTLYESKPTEGSDDNQTGTTVIAQYMESTGATLTEAQKAKLYSYVVDYARRTGKWPSAYTISESFRA